MIKKLTVTVNKSSSIISFASATIQQWKIKSKYLLNTTNIKTGKAIRKYNFHDYNFDDWEETTPLLYFDDTDETKKRIAETTSEQSTPVHETQSQGTETMEATETTTETTTTVDTTTYEEPQSLEVSVSPSNATVKDVLEHYLTTTEGDIWTPDIHIINNSM